MRASLFFLFLCTAVTSCTSLLGDFTIDNAAVPDGGGNAEAGEGGSTTEGGAGVPLANATQVAAGERHSCARLADKSVVCWGANAKGQLGVEGGASAKAVTVQKLGNVLGIAAGYRHTCAIDENRNVWCWGANECGQLGQGSRDQNVHATPAQVAGEGDAGGALAGIGAIAASENHTCAVSQGGALYCWGCNDNAQLGVRGTTFSSVPLPVNVGVANISVSAGAFHTCATVRDNTRHKAACWGQQRFGELGNNVLTSTSFDPVDVLPAAALDAPRSIAAGLDHSCGVDRAGKVFCWGNNAGGQIGSFAGQSSPQAVTVDGLDTGVAQIVAGLGFTCARLESGGVRCFGKNDPMQLASKTPVAVANLDATDLSAGGQHACAVTRTGSVACWGQNGAGQLGSGNNADSKDPVTVQR